MTDHLEPDRDQLEIYFESLFRHRGTVGYVSMRSFLHNNEVLKPIQSVPLDKSNWAFLVDVAVDQARRAANSPKPAVFAPPIAVFNNPNGWQAREEDLYRGLVITAELDEHPEEARQKLQDILGEATLVVKSGGQWINGGGEPEDKLHLHWRLAKPAQSDDLKKLKRARALVALIVGGDPSNIPTVHCLRAAGSWHRKATPRLCSIFDQHLDIEIDLDQALKLLEAEAPPFSGGDGYDYSGDYTDLQELVRRIKTGESLHPSVGSIAGKYARKSWPIETCIELVGSAFTMANQPRYGGRWEECVDYIRWVYAKEEAKKTDDTIFWHGDVDYRISQPQLIADVLPEVGCGLLAGQWGLFKTFAAFEIAHSCLSGAPFIGHEVVRKGGVLFIALEGSNEVPIRLEAVIKERGIIKGRAPFAWKTSFPPLVRQNAAAAIVRLAEPVKQRLQEQFGVPLVLIVIDTVIAGAGFYKDGQESDAVSGQLVMNTMNRVGRALGCFVLGIDHFGKAVETGTRGTSAKEAAADVVLATLGDRAITGAVSNTRLALRKRRFGPAGEEYAFTARVVDMGEDDNGRPLTSMVLDWPDWTEVPPTIVTSMSDSKAKSNRLLMRVLETLLADHGVPHTPFADGPTVRAIKIELVEAEFIRQYPTGLPDSKRRQFDRSIRAAQSSGQIGSRADDLGQQWVWRA